MGIPEIEAKQYDSYVNDGRILVLVDSHVERDGAVYDTFRTNNSINANSYNTMQNAGSFRQ